VKNGLRYDVKSHICWHVYGLLHRSDSNYKEAIKCYFNALKIDPDNQNILRDLSWLQVQMRDMAGFAETRKIILKSSKGRNSWVALAVANFASEDYQGSFDIVEEYNKAFSGKDKAEAYEESELLLFQNSALEKMGKYAEAIEHLIKHKKQIKDMLSWSTKQAELMALSGNFEEALTKWKALVVDQPDNYRFHCGLQAAQLQLDAEQSASMYALKRLNLPSTTLTLDRPQLLSLRELYKECNFKSKFVRNIVLTFYKVKSSSDADYSEEDSKEFASLLDEHMKYNLRKGMPALYHDVCSLILLPDPFNAGRTILPREPFDFVQHPITKIATGLVDGYIHNLRETETFDKGEDLAKEAPPALLWALYLKCHLLELSGDLKEAMLVIGQCIEHTPTALDMYCKKAKLLKIMGDYFNSATVMDDCRLLDLQDRYLNNKTTKYLLRADEMQQAMSTISMFTKHEGDSQKILYELQCNWYEIEAAESYARMKQWGPCLKKFSAVKKHFNDYYDEMFDFHGYCVRKTTLRAYWDVITMQDSGYTHKFYQRAARGALKLYIHLLDCPEDIDGLGHLPVAERTTQMPSMRVLRPTLK
jgi:tetratricopeptide (TPR) repeat protein